MHTTKCSMLSPTAPSLNKEPLNNKEDKNERCYCFVKGVYLNYLHVVEDISSPGFGFEGGSCMGQVLDNQLGVFGFAGTRFTTVNKKRGGKP